MAIQTMTMMATAMKTWKTNARCTVKLYIWINFTKLVVMVCGRHCRTPSLRGSLSYMSFHLESKSITLNDSAARTFPRGFSAIKRAVCIVLLHTHYLSHWLTSALTSSSLLTDMDALLTQRRRRSASLKTGLMTSTQRSVAASESTVEPTQNRLHTSPGTRTETCLIVRLDVAEQIADNFLSSVVNSDDH